jgi:aerotaxis receptor
MKINLPVNERELNFDDSTEIISTTDLKGRIDTLNQDFITISGFTQDECIGQNHNMVRHPEMPPEAFADLWEHLKDGKPWMGMVKNRCKNGDYYWVDAFVSPQYTDGHVDGYQSVRFKPRRDWVERANTLYNRIMKGKSDEDKRRSKLAAVKLQRFPLGIAGKLMLGTMVVSLPLFIFLFYLVDPSKWWMLIIGGVIAGGGAYFNINRIIGPLKKLAKESEKIAYNPIARYLYTGQNDEAGQLAYAYYFTTAKLRTAIGRVRESSEVLERSAHEIAHGSTDLSQRTEEQASSLQQTASSMEEMTSTVKQNADNARQANQLAANARNQAEQGGAVVSRAVSAMREISASSKSIGDIISVIDEIAFQTNLLALNAAVEAARAGEQGRGFAVVAGEVRTLAGRSAEAAKQIKALISDSLAKVDHGSQLVDESGRTLQEIVTSVKKVTDIMAEIAAASQEQAIGIEQVNKAVMQMDEITQQNAALVEETAAASDEMVSKVKILSGLALQFRMED